VRAEEKDKDSGEGRGSVHLLKHLNVI